MATIRLFPSAPSALDQAFALDESLLAQPGAQHARQVGLLRAKSEALRSAEQLAAWARPLLLGVLMVSFLHLWQQIALIAPAGVPTLVLPPAAHWLSAALLTASVDASALYLVAARATAQQAHLVDEGRLSLLFFYVLTGALNSVFVLSHTPALPAPVAAVTPALALVGAVLLGLLVPVSIATIERARQVATVARLSLLIDVETLRGVVAAQPEGEDAEVAIGGVRDRNATKAHERTYHCKRCSAGPLTFDELGRHSRRCTADRTTTIFHESSD